MSLTPRRELRALALPSEIMRLANLEGYLKLPGPFPVASIRLKYVARPAAAERFVPREDARAESPDARGGRDDCEFAAPSPPAEPVGDGGMAIPALPGEAGAEPAGAPGTKDEAPEPAPRPDEPEPVPLPGEAGDVLAGAGEPSDGEPGNEDRDAKDGGAPGKSPGIAI